MPSADATVPTIRHTFSHIESFLDDLHNHPIATRDSIEKLRAQLDVGMAAKGLPPQQVIDEFVQTIDGGLIRSGSARFFAWVLGGVLPSARAADMLTSAWDQNGALYAVSPAAAIVEEIAGSWLKDVLDLPREASFAFTSGCQLAHFTCLASARHAVLEAAGWDVNAQGLFGAPPIRVLVSQHRHASIDRTIRFLGMGHQALVVLEADDEGRVKPAALQQAITEHAGPSIVVLDAADLNIAAFDDFATLIPIAKEAGAWVHIDGAFGLFARASRAKRHLVAGVELADSWATDGHKWLNVPFDCGMAFVRHSAAHRAAMRISAAYIAEEKQARDEIDWNPEWSRRSRGFTVYAALRELGREGLEELIDRCCRHADALVTGIGALPGAEMVWKSELNQGLVRFLDPSPHATPEDHDLRTFNVMSTINASGQAFFSGTVWKGRHVMRISVVNWRTSEEDVEKTLATVARVVGSG